MNPRSPVPHPQGESKVEAFQVVLLILGVLLAAASVTLHSVAEPGSLQVDSPNPTPYGYTLSLLLFLLPLAVLAWWFFRHPEQHLPRKAFWRTIAVLVPSGFVLDLLFGNYFFRFPNHGAVLGLGLPAVGGPIPVEEFVFYLSGFMVVLLCYIWGDEYWMAAYNIPDYAAAAQGLPRLARFHPASVVVGALLWGGAILYKKTGSAAPDGFPWYFTYLVIAAIIPSAGFFATVRAFINWRAFSFALFFILLVSLLWEATLAVPYGWWGYNPRAMIGLNVRAWSGLPLEAVCVWLAVTYTTVIAYEVIKIWKALGVSFTRAFFGRG